jgi:hypothetical protein
MDLKEYGGGELKVLSVRAGFERQGMIQVAGEGAPTALQCEAVVSQDYLGYLTMVDTAFGSIGPHGIHARAVSASKLCSIRRTS